MVTRERTSEEKTFREAPLSSCALGNCLSSHGPVAMTGHTGINSALEMMPEAETTLWQTEPCGWAVHLSLQIVLLTI